MGAQSHIQANGGDISAESLHRCIERAYGDREIAEQQPRLFEDLIAGLLLRGYCTTEDIERMVARTKSAVEQYEEDPESPSALSVLGILRASMLLMDMLADGHVLERNPLGFDTRALRVLQKYVEYVRPEDHGGEPGSDPAAEE